MVHQKLDLWANSEAELETLKDAVANAFGNNSTAGLTRIMAYQNSGRDHERSVGYKDVTNRISFEGVPRYVTSMSVDVEDASDLRGKMNAAISNLPANRQANSVAYGKGIAMGKEKFTVIEGDAAEADQEGAGGSTFGRDAVAAEATL